MKTVLLHIAAALLAAFFVSTQYAALIRTDYKKYGKLVKDIGARVE